MKLERLSNTIILTFLLLMSLIYISLTWVILEQEKDLEKLNSTLMDIRIQNSELQLEIDGLNGPAKPNPILIPDVATIELAARIIEKEAGGESLTSKVAVANVLMNRMEDPRFPNDLRGVITSRGQFESYETGDYLRVQVSRASYEALERALAGENVVPGAMYFCNYDLIGPRNKQWFDSLKEVDQIGNHRFYR